jgi:hypothetical protein
MGENFELPKDIDSLRKFLEVDGCHVFETLVCTVFGVGGLELKG